MGHPQWRILKRLARKYFGTDGVRGRVGDAPMTVDFTLPDTLRTADTLGAMRIDFGATDASYSDGTGSQPAPTGTINPNGPIVRRVGAGGMLIVWIGGTVYPRVSQTGGDYSAEILLTVAYTGS
jgi:hypothetical protein